MPVHGPRGPAELRRAGGGEAGRGPVNDDVVWMRLALEEARGAAAAGDVPVGAVVVRDGALVARARNRREADGDPTAHAEVVALREAARALGRWYLDGATVYVTLEPCPMCAGALVLARVARLVFGPPDPRAGAAGTLYNIVQDHRLNHRLAVTPGVLADESAELLRAFFRARRS
jgi:tRNA(adenine34) deaminase